MRNLKPEHRYRLPSMPPVRFGKGDLLEYNAQYKLLICRQCQYAIQKSALESHLLRHKIYRGDRKRLLSAIAQLDLLEPQDLSLPNPDSPPVDGLPVLSGFCCTAAGCRHLTATSKRMRNHWTEVHGLDGSAHLSSSPPRPVRLQTFFRGTQIKYFEVSSSALPESGTDDNDDGHGSEVLHGTEDNKQSSAALTSIAVPVVSSLQHPPTATSINPSSTTVDFDLETLTYFHHFMTRTSSTLPSASDSQSGGHHWQMHVMSCALQQRWLMYGLLAISAHHLAVLTDDMTVKQTHRERAAKFSSHFSTGLGLIPDCTFNFDVAPTEQEVKKIGQQIQCLLRCIQRASEGSISQSEPMVSSEIICILSTIRGCTILSPSTNCDSMQDIAHKQQDEQLAQGFLQTQRTLQEGSRTKSPNSCTPPVLLECLRTLPFGIAEKLGRTESTQDVFSTLSAVKSMIECCDVSFASEDRSAVWQGLITWLANVSDHFNQMISHDHPAALILLAHWAAILVKRAENTGCWFLKGAAKCLVLQVTRRLSTTETSALDLINPLMNIVSD